MQTLGCPIMYLEDGKATFYPSFAALQNRDAGKTQEQQKTEDTAKKQAYGKEQRKRRAEVRARLKKVESEIEELGAHIVRALLALFIGIGIIEAAQHQCIVEAHPIVAVHELAHLGIDLPSQREYPLLPLRGGDYITGAGNFNSYLVDHNLFLHL